MIDRNNKTYVGFLDCAVGLYEQGLELLQPEREDFSIISGCILLVVGLEKLIKHALESKNPLMILPKMDFDDVVAVDAGNRLENRHTVSLETAFKRLLTLYPKLSSEKGHTDSLVEDRNFLVHGSGYFDAGMAEERVRVNLTNITEMVCLECLGKNPADVFGKKIWGQFDTYREAYEDAHILAMNERIAFLRRLYQQGQPLPCEPVTLWHAAQHVEDQCPVCGSKSQIEIGMDGDWDEAPYSYISKYVCNSCGFALADADEIELLLGKGTVREILYGNTDEDYRD